MPEGCGQRLLWGRGFKDPGEQVVIFSFDGEEKEVISILYIYEKLYEAVGEDIQMHSIGESDCVIDLTDGKRPPKLWSKIQVVFVSLVTFFGAAFSIMTYNEDAGVPDVFKTLYEMILGEPSGKGFWRSLIRWALRWE